ncbi:MAG: hypothetical protein ACOY82_04525 [Pseudomonadota bacterium]
MTTDIDPLAFETNIALRNGACALKEMRSALEHAMRKLLEYEEDYDTAVGLLDKARVLNWALAHVCTSVITNARIDLAASAQAELHALGQRVDAL